MGLYDEWDDNPAIINPNESHMACMLLVDTSGSMSGEAIESLNEGLNNFKRDVIKDKRTEAILDVAIVEFNSTVRVVQPWCPISNMEPVKLTVLLWKKGLGWQSIWLKKEVNFIWKLQELYHINRGLL